MWEPSTRYPDPAIRTLDPSFAKYRLAAASVERLATGCRWSEGPVWFGDGRFLLWSDIPNNRILRWDEETGAVSVFRHPSGNANGNTRDRQGRLVTCEHDTRRVTRTEYDGNDHRAGRPVRRQAAELAERRGGEIGRQRSGSPIRPSASCIDTKATQDDVRAGARGLPDRPADRHGRHGGRRRSRTERAGLLARRKYPLRRRLPRPAGPASPGLRRGRRGAADARAACSSMPARRHAGWVPGDVDGNLWCGWGMGTDELDGVRIFNPAGAPIGHIALPERCANLCFGGRHRNRLFMAASHGLYSLYVATQGVAGG